MRILIDTNVILDVLLKRETFYGNAEKVLNLSGRDDIELYVSASAITDIYYIANQMHRNKTAVKELLSKLLEVVSVAGVSEDKIRHALGLTWRDFEDSVQYSVALLQEMEGIVTRNKNDYAESKVEVWRPEELLSFIQK